MSIITTVIDKFNSLFKKEDYLKSELFVQTSYKDLDKNLYGKDLDTKGVTVTFSLGEEMTYSAKEIQGLTVEELIIKAAEDIEFEQEVLTIKENGVLVTNRGKLVQPGASYTLYTKIATKG